MKPYYEHSGITIYHGDCRDVLPTVKADAVVSDPPYGIASWSANSSGGFMDAEEAARRKKATEDFKARYEKKE